MGLFDRFRKRFHRSDSVPEVDKLMQRLRSSDVLGRSEIVSRFNISEDEFNTLYVNYHFSLLMSGDSRDWNNDIDDFARDLNALSEKEIEAAGTNLHQAILNRIQLRLVSDGTADATTAEDRPDTFPTPTRKLVQFATWSASSSYTKMTETFPSLPHMRNISDWDFFVTTAIIGSAVFHLQMTLGHDAVDLIQSDIASELTGVHPQAWDAISDLVQFINRAEKPSVPEGTLTDRMTAKLLTEIHEQMGASIGSWVVWNLKGESPSHSDLPLLSAIGRFCYEGVGEELSAEFMNEDV